MTIFQSIKISSLHDLKIYLEIIVLSIKNFNNKFHLFSSTDYIIMY
jgi:hypothetical protein